MFPGIYDFRWDTAHVIFLGAFYIVGFVIALTLAAAWHRTRRDLAAGKVDRIRWHEEFRELPGEDRLCRHTLAGRAEDRICPNEFDCRSCEEHARIADHPAETGAGEAGPISTACGFRFPLDRAYHRGHTWVGDGEDGTFIVGLDDLASRAAGPPESVELPPPGTSVRVNGTAWRMSVDGIPFRVLCPVDGEVAATGGPGMGWYLRIRPSGDRTGGRHLLRGADVLPWILREVDMIQRRSSAGAGSASLADGGVPVEELHLAIPEDRREEILGRLLLEP